MPPVARRIRRGLESFALAVVLAGAAAAEDHESFALVGGTIVGGDPVALCVREGTIAAVGDACAALSLPETAIDGQYLAPAWIDSHIHLAFRFSAPELLRGGVIAAVDLASPLAFLQHDLRPLRAIRAGPMVTAPGGYPTKSWGSDGYGLEVAGPDAARYAVDSLHERGAGVVKIPVGDATGRGALPLPPNPARLDDATLRAVVERAHARGMRVAVHAITDNAALRAARAGADVLAHTPVTPLDDATVDAWSRGAVISTLSAFGDAPQPLANLRRLRAAGTTVLYGTDMGYTDVPGISAPEIARLVEAGLDAAAILAAATERPAAFWGLEGEWGALGPGRPASFLLLDRDPLDHPEAFASPVAVYVDGVVQPREPRPPSRPE